MSAPSKPTDSVVDDEGEVNITSHRPSVLRLVEDLRHERHSPLSLSALHYFCLNFMVKENERKFRRRPPALLPFIIPYCLFLLILLGISVATAFLPSPRPNLSLFILIPISVILVLSLFIPVLKCNWWSRNIVSGFVLLLPGVIVLTRPYPCPPSLDIASCLLVIPSIAVICLPSSLSAWTKTVSAFVVLIAAIPVFLLPQNCHSCVTQNLTLACNVSGGVEAKLPLPPVQSGITWLFTLFLVVFMSREIDIAQRLDFLCGETVKKEQRAVKRAKQQADWLLHNIIPERIVEELKINDRYFRKINCCGVIFADISNFSYFYDEQFHGGQAMLGVLNDLFADIEKLMTQPKYRQTVEKIKTVGSCFMAASGLDSDNESWEHVHALLNFCLDVRTAVTEFNKSMFCFDFELKIGLSVGPLSAGVFGKKRLLYDILGDTVNQAFCLSSAATTPGIRVPIFVAEKCNENFVFEPAEELSGKAASAVQTCLLIGRK